MTVCRSPRSTPFVRTARLALAAALALAATAASAAPGATPSPTAAPDGFRGGLYQGLIDGAGELNPAQVRFESTPDGGWRAQVRIGGRDEPLPATVAFEGPQLTLAMPGPDGPLACRGEVRAEAVVAAADAQGCRLELVAAQDGTLGQALAGAWQDADGQLYGLARLGDSPQPMWLDYRSGAWRAVVERDGALHFGPASGTPWPRQASLVPEGDALWLRPADGTPAAKLQRMPIHETPLEWQAGDATLKGTLLLPAGLAPDARVPVVVFTHMSGAGERDAYRQFAYFFLAHGMGALIYDRRGSGASGGDEATAGMHRLADDAVAAVQAVAALPHVDATRLGTFGHSQGGWIAPLAAARSPRVAFVIAQAASGVSPALQEIYRVESNARDAGLDASEVAAAVAYERLLMNWARTGEGREQVHATARANRTARWARYVELREDLPAQPSARAQSFWWFDPAPDLARVRVPVLVIHGELDGYVPVEESRRIMRAAMGEAPVTFVLLPHTAHGLWTGARDSAREVARSPGFAPEYWSQLLGWLRAQKLAP